MDVPVGMHGWQSCRRLVVVQGQVDQLACFLVLVLGLNGFLRGAVGETELPAADVATPDDDRRQGFAAGCLPALARKDQQLAVGDLRGAVMVLGEPGDEVEV